ncbi:MAG: glycoside hydrolase N-terminal domain-containing protein [Clostridia bacterium]|nr:glycoside hydrolase N-terminal domain-containing protein [Clostridia bacterium]
MGNDSWRYGLVCGNGENGMVESCAPASDVMIFQNMKFNYPSNAIRMTPDTSSVREETMQSILNYNGKYLSPEGAQNANNLMLNAASEWMKEMGLGDKWSLQWTYSFHPGHQLRIQMKDAKNGEEKFYERYTDYQTGEIGTNWVDKNGNGWERRSFASREDNVNFTSIKSTDGKKLSLTLTIDDIARMSNEGGADVKNLRYRKIVDTENGDYIGISAHYPYYPNSLLNNGGYAGVTRVVAIGGTKEYVFGTNAADSYVNPKGNATDAEMNLGEDKNPAIRTATREYVPAIVDVNTDGEAYKYYTLYFDKATNGTNISVALDDIAFYTGGQPLCETIDAICEKETDGNIKITVKSKDAGQYFMIVAAYSDFDILEKATTKSVNLGEEEQSFYETIGTSAKKVCVLFWNEKMACFSKKVILE